MARTPKRVRRNHGNCICADTTGRIRDKYYSDSTCKPGYCYSARCLDCRGELFGMGPIACPCDGAPRWARWKEMEPRGHWDLEADKWVPATVALKPGSKKFHRLPARLQKLR